MTTEMTNNDRSANQMKGVILTFEIAMYHKRIKQFP